MGWWAICLWSLRSLYWQSLPQRSTLFSDTFPGMDYMPALSKMPTKCTRILAHLFVVGRTSFQNTVSFPLSFGEPCLMLPIFRSLLDHCPWWGVCLQLLKMLFMFSLHFLNFFFSLFFFFSFFFSPPQSSFSLTNCEVHTRLSLRYFKRTQDSLNRMFSNAFLLSVQGHMIWTWSTFCQISLFVCWSFL